MASQRKPSSPRKSGGKAGPNGLLRRQAANLFPDVAERERFIGALMAGDSREQALIAVEDRPEIRTFPRQAAVDWQPEWVVRLKGDFRPGKHPLQDRGAIYILDFSSIFSASAMLAMDHAPRQVLDLCASPGGKSIFAYRAFRPDLLLANEPLIKRAGTLIANLHRCHVPGAAVWVADPSVYARKFAAAFDLAIADVPCSGQSLLAKGLRVPDAFSPAMADVNVGRQRRIAANAYQCLAPGGYLLYCTCTYSIKENEKVIDWLVRSHDDLEYVEVPHLAEYQSLFTDSPCYRLFPQSGLGAGAFTALLRRRGDRPVELPDLSDEKFLWRYGETPPMGRPDGKP